MNGNRLIALALVAVGIVLLYLGYQSSQGLDDQISEAVTGNFTDETVTYWILGAVVTIAGVLLFRKGR